MVERLPQSEYLSRWEPVRQRVFAGQPDGTFIFPFIQRSWEVVPIPNHPTSGNSPASWLPRRVAPAVVDEYAPLFRFLQGRGTRTIIVWSANSPAFTLCPTRDEVDLLLRTEDFCDVCHPSYFSVEADWGLQTFWEEVSVLGGTPEFMENFYHYAGGRDAVRQRFMDYDVGRAWALSHLQVSPTDLPVGPDGYPFNDAPRKSFYDMIGWEMPAYDMDQVRKDAPWLFKG